MVTRQVIVTALVMSSFASAAGATLEEDPLPGAASHSVVPVVDAARVPLIDKIAFIGLRRISSLALEAQITSRSGQSLDPSRIDSDVRALARLDWFASIRVALESLDRSPALPEQAEPHVQLNFYLEEYPFLTGVDYSGSNLLSSREIDKLLAERKLTPKLGEPENPIVLHQIAAAIKLALGDLARPEAKVQIQHRVSPNATVRVHFEIADGPHLPVGRVAFTDHPVVTEKALRREIRRISPGVFFAGLRGKDSYTGEAFEEDREHLLDYYQNHGYPEARIGAADVSKYEARVRRWFPRPRLITQQRLLIQIPIEAGTFYRIESVHIGKTLTEGAARRTKFLAVPSQLQPGKPYSVRAVENFRRGWQVQAHSKVRHDETFGFRNVDATRSLDSACGAVRINLDFSPTPPYLVRRLEFQGLHHFPDRYLRRRILLREEAPFDDHVLEVGLARVARTGYFKPVKKENIRVATNEALHTVDVTIHIEELGQQRASLVGGRGQFGNTIGVAYAVFNLFDREELLTSRIEGGPESLQLAISLAKEGAFGSRGSLALSLYDTFLRPRLIGSVKGPFLKQQSEGVDVPWSYALSNSNTLRVSYDLSRSKTQYSAALPASITGVGVSVASTETSRHAAGLGWTHDTGNERIVFSDAVSGGWLGGSESLVRSTMGYGRIVPDRIFDPQSSWAFRATFIGVGSYSGDMPFYDRIFSGDDFVRGLRPGELGPDAVVSSVLPSGATKYSAAAAGSNLMAATNIEYRVHLSNGTEASGFLDLGSGMLLPNWLGAARPTLADSTNALLHGSTGIQVQWTLPGIGVPVRAYYALNVLRLNRWVPMPDGSLFHARDRFSAIGWGLGSLF
jgi:outer membrane protein assembly complex protein YaeT